MGGPWENFVGYAVSFEQLVCSSFTGYDDGVPMIPGGFGDPLVGLHTAAAIELALIERERTGRGTAIEMPQCEILDSLWAPEHLAIQHGAPVPSRRGNRHDWMAPHNAYPVRGDDDWITIAVSSDAEFRTLVDVLDVPDLAGDERFATVKMRKTNEAVLDQLLAQALKDRDGVELEKELQSAGVKAYFMVKGWLLVDDPNLRHLNFFQTLTRQHSGTHPYKTWPFRFSGIDMSHKRPPPLLGEHNAEVLCGLLGVSKDELERLREKQVIGNEPIGFRG
jgi:crotonobetainyl-CoA:carnitine CoA-transferase CaiB-like acyl-CoA transferase